MRILVPMSKKERGRGDESPYLQALLAGGARPDELAPLAPGEALPAAFDGLLLTGGADVDPGRYGEANRASSSDIERDAMDFALIEQALQAQIPVFAICRGMQVLNVALGGSLYQDLLDDEATARSHRAPERAALVHEIEVVSPHARLHALIPSPCPVNSLHHQAVRNPAPRLEVTARSSGDGIVEGLEPDFPYPWLLAVQWHPEELRHDPVQRRLFETFVNACR